MPSTPSLITRRTALTGFAAGLASGCAGGAVSTGVSGANPDAPVLFVSDPALEQPLARGAALGAGVDVNEIMLLSTAQNPAPVSNAARAVIGPVRAANITQARAAAGSNTMLLSLSNDARAAQPGVALLGVSARESVGRILEYAGRRGVRRLAVLGGGDAWSIEAVRAARLLAPRLDLELVAAEQAPGTPGAGQLNRVSASDAVLLPPGGAALERLATPLSGSGVQLLGTHQWALGAAPIGGWRSGLDPNHARSFRRQYAEAYREPATHLAMLAFDAARVARSVTASGPRDWAPVNAASGVIEFDEAGLAWRGLAVVAVEQDGDTLIEGRASA